MGLYKYCTVINLLEKHFDQSSGVLTFFQSHTTVTPDDIKLEAESPTGRRIKMNGDGDYHAQFSAEEIGRLTFFYNLHINDRILNQNAASYCTQCLLQVTTQT